MAPKRSSTASQVAKLRSSLVSSIGSSAAAEQQLKLESKMILVWEHMQANMDQVECIADAVLSNAFAPKDPTAGLTFEAESHRYMLKLPRDYVITLLKYIKPEVNAANLKKCCHNDRYYAHKLLYFVAKVDSTVALPTMNKIVLANWLVKRAETLGGKEEWHDCMAHASEGKVEWSKHGWYQLQPEFTGADGEREDHVYETVEMRGSGEFNLPKNVRVTAKWTLTENYSAQQAKLVPTTGMRLKVLLFNHAKEHEDLAEHCKQIMAYDVTHLEPADKKLVSALKDHLGAYSKHSGALPASGATTTTAAMPVPQPTTPADRREASKTSEEPAPQVSPKRLKPMSPSQIQARLAKIRRTTSQKSAVKSV
eukprot:2899488-Amphidinium_carterae.2